MQQSRRRLKWIDFVIATFPESEYETVHTLVDQVRLAHFRLVWIAGNASSVRSSFLAQCAEKFNRPILHVGKILSSCLLDQPAPLRPTSAEEAFYDMLISSKSNSICLDHLEILFDESLKLKAVDLVRNASRRFVLIASWPGIADTSHLTFGTADHPSHYRIPFPELECPVHHLSTS